MYNYIMSNILILPHCIVVYIIYIVLIKECSIYIWIDWLNKAAVEHYIVFLCKWTVLGFPFRIMCLMFGILKVPCRKCLRKKANTFCILYVCLAFGTHITALQYSYTSLKTSETMPGLARAHTHIIQALFFLFIFYRKIWKPKQRRQSVSWRCARWGRETRYVCVYACTLHFIRHEWGTCIRGNISQLSQFRY